MKTKLFPLALIFLFACSEDDPDIRDQAIGTYNYNTTLYYIDGGSLEETGITASGTMIAEKDGSNISFKEGGEVSFKATKIAAASNGFTFDVPTQTVDGITFNGYPGIDLAGILYHGMYEAQPKRITAFYQFTDDGVVYVLELIATKL